MAPALRPLDQLQAETRPAILLSEDYRVLAANAAYRARFGDGIRMGHDRCHAVSYGYAVPCDQVGESCPLQRALETDQPARVLHIHHGPDGPEHVDVQARPLRDPTSGDRLIMEVLDPVSVVGADGGMVGRSPAFLRCLELARRVADSELPVLILGETGVGKDGLARAIHRMSARRGSFVALECSGLPEALFESEMFGYERGAFTGAHSRKPGLVEVAAEGTLFLDEIGELPLSQQARLLRLLESRTYRRVGGLDPQHASFRLVCATHRDLVRAVAEGSFREDLYYRIAAFPIRVPPLRERLQDLPALVDHLLRDQQPPRRLSAAARRVLMRHAYPGNVRELRHLLQRAALLADGEEIRPEHLPESLQGPPTAAPAAAPVDLRPLESVEHDHLAQALAGFAGDRRQLAAALGLSERSLYRKLRAHGLIGGGGTRPGLG